MLFKWPKSYKDILTLQWKNQVFQEGFINTKMLLFHIELVLPVSFQMLPALGTLLFRSHYLTGARPSQTALRHAIGEGVVCVWLTKQVSDGPPSRAVFKYRPCVTAVMNSHVHTVRMYMFRSVLGQIKRGKYILVSVLGFF